MPTLFVHPKPHMNDAAILQMFAIAYLAVGIGGLVEPNMAKELVRDFENNRALSYVTGLVTIIIGYAIVASRPEAQTFTSELVTVLGAVALIKGFCLIAFPKWSFRTGEFVAKSKFILHVFPYAVLLMSGAAFWFSQSA